MNDIVDRLRGQEPLHLGDRSAAADVIERLRAELSAVKSELRDVTIAVDDERVNNTMTLAQCVAEAVAQNEALLEKLDALAPTGTCACSYDASGDVCMRHSPEVMRLRAELAESRAKHLDDRLVLEATAKTERLLRAEMAEYRRLLVEARESVALELGDMNVRVKQSMSSARLHERDEVAGLLSAIDAALAAKEE